MIFKKEFLQDKVYDCIHEEIVDTTRWSIIMEMIFEHEGKYYRVQYSKGATESQYEAPFEYADNEIECDEVELKEVVVKKWVKVTK